jgi:hypothetical protein
MPRCQLLVLECTKLLCSFKMYRAPPRTDRAHAQQALIQQLLVDVNRHVPAFALEMLAAQVLNEPTNLEMSTIGLRSLRAVVLSPPTFSHDKASGRQAVPPHCGSCCMPVPATVSWLSWAKHCLVGSLPACDRVS